jgi:hypothetical protein
MGVWKGAFMRCALPMLFVVVRISCVIVHPDAGRRPWDAGRERAEVRSVRVPGPCDRKGTSAVSTLDSTSRIVPRRAPGRSRESRSAAGAIGIMVENTVCTTKALLSFPQEWQ